MEILSMEQRKDILDFMENYLGYDRQKRTEAYKHNLKNGTLLEFHQTIVEIIREEKNEAKRVGVEESIIPSADDIYYWMNAK